MPFLYTSCVLDYALRFLMIFILLIKKKNLQASEKHGNLIYIVPLSTLYLVTLFI